MFTKFKNWFSRLLGNSAPTDGTYRYEEIAEKQTSKAGYFLLLVMFVFLLIAGETSLGDFAKIPTRPVGPSVCAQRSLIAYANYVPKIIEDRYLYSYKDLNNTCFTSPEFGALDTEFGIDTLYRNMTPTLIALSEIDTQIEKYQSTIYQNEYERQDLQNSYDLSLQEKMANEQVLYNTKDIQQRLAVLLAAHKAVQEPLTLAKERRAGLVQELQVPLQELKTAYELAVKKHQVALAWYKVFVFLAQLAFVAPIFAIVTRWYLVLKKRNSRNTIIALSAFAAATVLFVQVMLVFLYDIIPHQWFLKLLAWFQDIVLLRYVLYYGTVLLVIAVFGGIVYLIQKRLFDKKILAIRRLKNNKCPSCEFTLGEQQDFCARCGTHVREVCTICHGKRFLDLPFCPSCGSADGVNSKV